MGWYSRKELFVGLIVVMFIVWLNYKVTQNNSCSCDNNSQNASDLNFKNEEKSNESSKQKVLERNTCAGNYDEDTIIKANSDPLPTKSWSYDGENRICEKKDAKNCVPKFVEVTRTYEGSRTTKTVHCLLHKNMSTVFKILACFLGDPLKFLYYGNDLVDYEHWLSRDKTEAKCGKYYNENWAPSFSAIESKYNIKPNDDWQFSMIVRDPVDRFLSGYIHFCYYGHIIDCSRYCNGCNANMTCFLEKELENMFKVAENKNITDLKTDHMIQQNWQCGLSQHFERYKFLRYNSDSAKFVDQELAPYLKSRNVSDDALYYIRDRLTSTRSKHSTSTSPVKPFLEKRLRESSYLMEIIVRLFYYDYKLFNFTLPTVP